jgi:hypothetical protein
MRGERILALEIRPQRIGFIVINGVARALDWGICTNGKSTSNRSSGVTARIASLLDLYSPAVVVIRRRRAFRKSCGTIRVTMTEIAADARRRSIPCRLVSDSDVRQFFVARGVTTKHAVASLLAEWFPDLLWKLPPKRQLWQSEFYRAPIFDAAATAVTFLSRR